MIEAVRVITSYAVRAFVKAGGTLRYRPDRDEDGRYWKVLCVDKDGTELPVIISRTGEPKILRSADAVVNYEKSMFPEIQQVVVPLPEDDPVEDASDSEG